MADPTPTLKALQDALVECFHDPDPLDPDPLDYEVLDWVGIVRAIRKEHDDLKEKLGAAQVEIARLQRAHFPQVGDGQ